MNGCLPMTLCLGSILYFLGYKYSPNEWMPNEWILTYDLVFGEYFVFFGLQVLPERMDTYLR